MHVPVRTSLNFFLAKCNMHNSMILLEVYSNYL